MDIVLVASATAEAGHITGYLIAYPDESATLLAVNSHFSFGIRYFLS